ECRTRPLDLAGGGGEEFTRGGRFHAEHGGDLVGGEVVAHGQFERLPLLRGGTGGLRPGQQGQFAPALLLDVLGDGRDRGAARRALLPGGAARRVGGLTFLLSLRPLAQTGPAGQRVQPGAAVADRVPDVAAAPLREGEDVGQGGGRRLVVAQDGQAVGEQAGQVGLVTQRGPLRHRAGGPSVAHLPVRPVCAGRTGRG